MKKDQKTKTDQPSDGQFNVLLDEVKGVVEEIDKTNEQSLGDFNTINTKVDKSIATVENICSDLDQAEKEALDEIDKLILQEAEALAEE